MEESNQWTSSQIRRGTPFSLIRNQSVGKMWPWTTILVHPWVPPRLSPSLPLPPLLLPALPRLYLFVVVDPTPTPRRPPFSTSMMRHPRPSSPASYTERLLEEAKMMITVRKKKRRILFSLEPVSLPGRISAPVDTLCTPNVGSGVRESERQTWTGMQSIADWTTDTHTHGIVPDGDRWIYCTVLYKHND